MPKPSDITGKKYGKLTALHFEGYNKHKQRVWRCVCECGTYTLVTVGALSTGNTKSCGCQEGFRKHGGTGKGSYNTWRAMIRRCTNPKDKDYAKYGKAGIKVQDSWLDYENFAADMGEPEGDKTLHRVDPYGDYTKENCVWATPTTQARDIRKPARNKSGVVGVMIAKNGKYYACLHKQKTSFYGKVRETVEEAAEDRKMLEKLHW